MPFTPEPVFDPRIPVLFDRDSGFWKAGSQGT